MSVLSNSQLDVIVETKPMTEKIAIMSHADKTSIVQEISAALERNCAALEQNCKAQEELQENEKILSGILGHLRMDSNGKKKNISKLDQRKSHGVKSAQLSVPEVTQFLFSSTQQLLLDSNTDVDSNEKMLKEQADRVLSYSFQQAINCCQITATAYALTSLGYPTTVDDIFLHVGVDVESAVGDGMTLAETHELASRYIHLKNLPIFVDCYHLDEGVASVEDLERALICEGNCGISDVISLNFHSGIAHGKKKGGGHFSVLVGYSQKKQEVVVSDVHPMKYGAFWATPLKQMYAAMRDKDSIGRSRGMLHFGNLDSVAIRPLPGLNRARSLICWSSPLGHSKLVFKNYIPYRWGALMGCRNMGGVSALTLALRALQGPKSHYPELDDIMRTLKESYTYHLNTFLNASKIEEIAKNWIEIRRENISVSLLKLQKALTGEMLRTALKDANCGQEGVTVLAAFNMNQAQGLNLVKEDLSEAGALCHGAKTWALVASFIPEANVTDRGGVVVATAFKVEMYGRLWTCSLENLAKGMAAVGSDSFVVLSHHPSDK